MYKRQADSEQAAPALGGKAAEPGTVPDPISVNVPSALPAHHFAIQMWYAEKNLSLADHREDNLCLLYTSLRSWP